MVKQITESQVEQAVLDILSAQGYGIVHGPKLGLFLFAKVDVGRAYGGV